jgi:quercetin dioxygenase-like cupin family protein
MPMRFAVAALLSCLFIAHADDIGVMRKMSDNKFAPLPGMPQCTTLAVESGDPTKGPSVILIKAAAGCMIPWHWHTPTEQVMMVSGSAKVEMKDSGTIAVLGPGGYAMMPSKHVHQFTCTSACSAFVGSDAAFDIHYVDANGGEISPEQAVAFKVATQIDRSIA